MNRPGWRAGDRGFHGPVGRSFGIRSDGLLLVGCVQQGSADPGASLRNLDVATHGCHLTRPAAAIWSVGDRSAGQIDSAAVSGPLGREGRWIRAQGWLSDRGRVSALPTRVPRRGPPTVGSFDRNQPESCVGMRTFESSRACDPSDEGASQLTS